MADDTPQFEKDAARMKRGMASAPLAYRKMYKDANPTQAKAVTSYSNGSVVNSRTDEAERRALGADGTYSEPGQSGSSTANR